MHIDHGGMVLSPTDLVRHLACAHLTNLDLLAAQGRLGPPEQTDEALELIFQLGLDHEKAYLQRLKDSGCTLVEIPGDVGVAAQAGLTEDTMRSGADAIYQATFLHDSHRGHADFLVRGDCQQLALAVFEWIEAWYNPKRRHSYCKMLSPVDYEAAHAA